MRQTYGTSYTCTVTSVHGLTSGHCTPQILSHQSELLAGLDRKVGRIAVPAE